MLGHLNWRTTCNPFHVTFDRIGSVLERQMDLLAARQRVVASNIANADTPGYRTRDVDVSSLFAAEFDHKLAADQEVAGLAARSDGNNVSLDREMKVLSENALRFQIASTLIRSELRVVRSALEGGKL